MSGPRRVDAPRRGRVRGSSDALRDADVGDESGGRRGGGRRRRRSSSRCSLARVNPAAAPLAFVGALVAGPIGLVVARGRAPARLPRRAAGVRRVRGRAAAQWSHRAVGAGRRGRPVRPARRRCPAAAAADRPRREPPGRARTVGRRAAIRTGGGGRRRARRRGGDRRCCGHGARRAGPLAARRARVPRPRPPRSRRRPGSRRSSSESPRSRTSCSPRPPIHTPRPRWCRRPPGGCASSWASRSMPWARCGCDASRGARREPVDRSRSAAAWGVVMALPVARRAHAAEVRGTVGRAAHARLGGARREVRGEPRRRRPRASS